MANIVLVAVAMVLIQGRNPKHQWPLSSLTMLSYAPVLANLSVIFVHLKVRAKSEQHFWPIQVHIHQNSRGDILLTPSPSPPLPTRHDLMPRLDLPI